MIIEERYEVYYNRSGKKQYKSLISCEKCHSERTVHTKNKNNQLCPKCANFLVDGITIDKYRNLAEIKNVTLVSTTIENVLTPVQWKCENDHYFLSPYARMKRIPGNGCAQCKIKTTKKKLNDYLDIAQSRNIQLVDKELRGCTNIKHHWICQCGRDWMATLAAVRKGYCKKCEGGKKRGENHYSWNPNREEVKAMDKSYKICRSFIHRCLRIKDDRTFNLLGYNSKQFKKHIESTWEPWMNWENYGMYNGKNKIWQVDHIKPIKDFLKEGITDLKIINALSNLRALEGKENLGRYKRKANNLPV